MEIFAGLIGIGDRWMIPLPWYNRPPLSLRSGTEVWAVMVQSTQTKSDSTAPPPDILLTPLEPARLKNTRSLTVDMIENVGAIGKVIEIISKDCNIDLMETVTANNRTQHRVRLVIQPKHDIQDSQTFAADRFFQNLKRKISALENAKVTSEENLGQIYIKYETARRKNVRGLQVDLEEYREIILNGGQDCFPNYDFTKVVVSSDTESRFIRIVFPKKGAFQLSVTHLDRPNAIRKISECLSQLNYNVLLSRVSKVRYPNSSHANDAESVLVCEPYSQSLDNRSTLNSAELRTSIQKSLASSDPEGLFSFALADNSVSFGSKPQGILQARSTDKRQKTIQVPFESEGYFNKIVSEPLVNRRVFVSLKSKFKDNGNLREIKNVIEKELARRNITYIDGFEESDTGEARNVTENEIFARIWSCQGAIFIAAAAEPCFLTENQRTEWAFAHAIIPNKVLVCHEDWTQDPVFMVTKESRATYSDLTQGDQLSLAQQIGNKLNRWFR